MKYTGDYLFPPRPVLFTRHDLERLTNGEWVAQLKLDDTRNLIIVNKDGVQMWNRHHELQKYQPSPELAQELAKLNIKKTMVLDTLLLHHKNKLIKNTLVIIDIMVHNNEYLFQSEYADRYNKLASIFNPASPESYSGLELGLECSKHIWLMQNFDTGFLKLFNKWEKTFNSGQRLVEGLVLKNKSGKLGFHYNSDKCDWQGKVRFPKEGIYRV